MTTPLLSAVDARTILYVEDYPAARGFYEALLGLPVVLEWGNGEGPGCIVLLGPGRGLELIGPPPGGFPDGWGGFDPRAVMLGIGVADAAGTLAALQAAGVAVIRELRDNPWGDRSFAIDDPSGIRVWIYEITDPAYATRLGLDPAARPAARSTLETTMKTDTRLGTIDEVLAGVDEALRAIALRLRDLIIAVDPETVETPRPGDRALSYGIGPKKMLEGYAYIMPQRGYVNLGFYRGTLLPDPTGLLEGSGDKLRHVKVRTMADAGRQEVRALIEAAVAERRGNQ